jgi:hypothetical protein
LTMATSERAPYQGQWAHRKTFGAEIRAKGTYPP